MNTIEITTDIADHFIKNKVDTDLKHLPYKEFEISFPYGTFQSEHDMFQSVIKSIGKPEFMIERDKILQVKALVKDYLSSNVTLTVESKSGRIFFNLKDKLGTRIVEFFLMGNSFPFVTHSNYPEHFTGMMIANNLVTITKGVIHHMTSPKTIKHKESSKEKSNALPRTGSTPKKQSVRYIYRTKYTFKNINTGISDRKYNKLTDSWEVAGHWRHYKSGKSTWIDPYTKGTGKAENKKLKITKID